MDKVVIIQLLGGLGNQMFQYAAGRALASKHQAQLLCDTSALGKKSDQVTHTIREFELDAFHTKYMLADHSQLRKASSLFNSQVLRFLRNFGVMPSAVQVVNESSIHSEVDFFELKPPVELIGYWQNEYYFKEVRTNLIAEFVPKNTPSLLNERIMREMADLNCASVHVRRGDYVSNPETNRYHGTCSVEYYHEAIEQMCSDLGVDHFFVFSDDPEWTKQHLSFPAKATYITHNSERESYWDLVLMSKCKHQIIANSSFSWWGAWLNTFEHKKIIAPKNWFAVGGGVSIVPEEWIKI